MVAAAAAVAVEEIEKAGRQAQHLTTTNRITYDHRGGFGDDCCRRRLRRRPKTTTMMMMMRAVLVLPGLVLAALRTWIVVVCTLTHTEREREIERRRWCWCVNVCMRAARLP